MPIALIYHDVVEPGCFRDSGFEGGDADRYKLDRDFFERHLDAIQTASAQVPAIISSNRPGEHDLLLTFDDGGSSASVIASSLERRGWRGHFFIPTDYIGRPGFLSPDAIRALDRRGHVIGSHSASHPACISRLPKERILEEWSRSATALAQILGHPIQAASVPAGFYSDEVARAAAQAGIRVLFNSEPVRSMHRVDNCWVVGRFSIHRGHSSRTAGALAAGALAPRVEQWAFWNAKKMLKNIGGEAWFRFRKRALANGPGA
jgi:peptidoglycan/xylan/chitin deacetylase (PgdA/CDA1 family)